MYLSLHDYKYCTFLLIIVESSVYRKLLQTWEKSLNIITKLRIDDFIAGSFLITLILRIWHWWWAFSSSTLRNRAFVINVFLFLVIAKLVQVDSVVCFYVEWRIYFEFWTKLITLILQIMISCFVKTSRFEKYLRVKVKFAFSHNGRFCFSCIFLNSTFTIARCWNRKFSQSTPQNTKAQIEPNGFLAL